MPRQQLLSLTYNAISEDEYNAKMGQNDTLAVLFSIIIMLRDPYIVTNFITDLKIVLSPYENTSFNGNSVFKLLGFPNNLFERLENLMQKKYT